MLAASWASPTERSRQPSAVMVRMSDACKNRGREQMELSFSLYLTKLFDNHSAPPCGPGPCFELSGLWKMAGADQDSFFSAGCIQPLPARCEAAGESD